MDGYGVKLAVEAPVFGGTATAAAGYMDAEASEDSAKEFNRYSVGATYKYPLSKRTFVYTAASYTRDDFENGEYEGQPSYAEAMFGMAHYF